MLAESGARAPGMTRGRRGCLIIAGTKPSQAINAKTWSMKSSQSVKRIPGGR